MNLDAQTIKAGFDASLREQIQANPAHDSLMVRLADIPATREALDAVIALYAAEGKRAFVEGSCFCLEPG